MAEPTSAITFYDLILAVAEIAGVAGYDSTLGIAHIPASDQYDLEKCRRVVNNGIRKFIADAPRQGWRWMHRKMELTFVPAVTGTADSGTATSLTDDDLAGDYADDYFNGYTIKITSGTGEDETATVTDYTGSTGKFDFSGGLSGGTTPDSTSGFRICPSTSVIDADPSRYLLDQTFGGQVDGSITYDRDTNHAARIEWCNESKIRAIRQTSVETGYPSLAAFMPYGTRRWELMVDPQPVAADTIVFPYTIFFDKLLIEAGTADSGSDTTLVDGTRWEPDDFFNGWVVRVVAGTGKGSYATVTDYTGSTGTFTVADWLTSEGDAGGTNPDADSVYYVEPASNLHPAGFMFDNAVYHACMAQAEIEFDDVSGGWFDLYNKKHLLQAYMLDARSAPRKLGYGGNGPVVRRERTWKDIDTSRI